MLVAALLVVPTIVVENSSLDEPWPNIAAALNWAIWLAFAIELTVMLNVARSRRRWLLNHPIDVAVVLLTPPFLPAALQGARVFRLLRLLRLIRGVQAARKLFSEAGLRYAALVGAFMVLIGGSAFTAVENSTQNVDTVDGLWWAVSTATTVGYGDIAPVTTAGRAIAVGLMVVGIGFVALVTGALAERFLEASQEDSGIEHSSSEILGELQSLSARLARIEKALDADT